MKDGFIKVGAGRINTTVADTVSNVAEILSLIDIAEKDGVKLLALPELCLSGASCGALFYNDTLLKGSIDALLKIKEATANKDITVIVGLPLLYLGKLYNCAAVLNKGEIIGIVPGNEESDIFTSFADEISSITILNEVLPFGDQLVFRCTALQNFSFTVTVGKSYTQLENANINVNICADIEIVESAEMRKTLIKADSYRNICATVYASCGEGESTTDFVYSGHLIICERGKILKENTPLDDTKLIVSEIDVSMLSSERAKAGFDCSFGEEFCLFFNCAVTDTALTRYIAKNPFVPKEKEKINLRAQKVLDIQSSGLIKRILHTNAKSVVIGISGGLDSTLALLVAAKAMDKIGRSRRDIIAISMPCFGTTSRTKSNAEILCRKLGVTFKEISIANSVKQHFKDIGHDINDHDLTFENAQARERTQLLMDMAGNTGGFVIGTGDLSELALGWATYNGDHMSMYSVNCSVPKTLIRAIVRYCAEKESKLSEVLLDIVDTPVSPELLPADERGEIAQKTEDLVGPYELHDFFIYYYCRFGFSISKIYRLAVYALGDIYDKDTIKKWLINFAKRFITQQFKRSCSPDGVKVGSVSFSPRQDIYMPSDAAFTLFKKEAENL